MSSSEDQLEVVVFPGHATIPDGATARTVAEGKAAPQMQAGQVQTNSVPSAAQDTPSAKHAPAELMGSWQAAAAAAGPAVAEKSQGELRPQRNLSKAKVKKPKSAPAPVPPSAKQWDDWFT